MQTRWRASPIPPPRKCEEAMRNLIMTSFLLLVCSGSELTAQDVGETTSLSRAALTATVAQVRASGTNRTGPYLVDVGSFSRVFRHSGSEVGASELLTGLDATARTADRGRAMVCVPKGTTTACQIADDGIYVRADSATFSPTDAQVVMRYYFSVRMGPKRDWPSLGFTQLRLIFHRSATGWTLVESRITLRS